MQTSFTGINWTELSEFGNGSAFAAWRLGSVEDPDWLVEMTLYSDSYRDYCYLSYILEEIVQPALDEPQSLYLRNSLMKVICVVNQSRIARDFPFNDDDCYYVVLSPDSVRTVLENLSKLNLDAVLTLAVDPFVTQGHRYTPDEAREYIEAFVEMVREAAGKKLGLLQHVG